MADSRSTQEIEKRAMHLCAVAFGVDGSMQAIWAWLSDKQKEGWRRVARAVRGVIHHEDATSGGFATAPQADAIRGLRESYPKDAGWTERSWIGAGTRPYGEMVVLFKRPNEVGVMRVAHSLKWIERGYLIHPDGHYEELHREPVG